MNKLTIAVSSALMIATIAAPAAAFAANTSQGNSPSSSGVLSQAQLNNKSYVSQLEQQNIQNYIQQHGMDVVSGTGTTTSPATSSASSTLSSANNDTNLQNHIAQVQKELQDPTFQASLTEQWESTHSTTSGTLNSSTSVTPDSIIVPTGSWEVETTHSNDPGLITDADKSAPDYSEAVSIAEDIASFFLSTVGNVAMDVITVVGSEALNKSEPVTSILYHNYDYGYKDLYIYNGSSWVDCFTTEDREWYRHELTSYIGANNSDYTKSYDFTQANGYSYVHQDHGTYYNDSDQAIYNEGVLYYDSNEHGYDSY